MQHSRDTTAISLSTVYKCTVPITFCEGFFRKSFMYSGTVIWISLPFYVKNDSSVNGFKSFYLKMETSSSLLILYLCVFSL